ncbi:MAG TPA: proteasome accessory factor PafA2 family protein [Planctomycetota bacterium]|nr:proteasome accessory factor PafA2 family protein [Planctomycetota bacterium]
MRERVFGMEAEYALVVLGAGGELLPTEVAADRLMRLARRSFPCLIDVSSRSGIFLVCGRLYVDRGIHPEFATVEVNHPSEAVRGVLAGERLLCRLAEELEKSPTLSEVLIFKCNVDYSGALSTWGCHESYLHTIDDPDLLRRQILPFLVSRVVLCGAGGFSPNSPGIEFSLSPRTEHLQRVSGESSTDNRPIYHTKDESLSTGGYHRLHLLCGESLCSWIATWWKVGATALVVAMIEAGLTPGENVQIGLPLTAMRTFARDPECRAVAKTDDGRRLTARQIQQAYLETAERHLHEPFMPVWAAEVCRVWRQLLDLLEGAPESVAAVLDWAMKLALFKDRVRRQGGPEWASLPLWNGVLRRVRGMLTREGYPGGPLTVEMIRQASTLVVDEVEQTRYLKRRGIGWDGLEPHLKLRAGLFEMDTRFGQLGPRGIFSQLDAADVLMHRVHGVDRIDEAVDNPPEFGRARVRGKCIQELTARKERYLCSWHYILDTEQDQMLDLHDPFCSEQEWQPRCALTTDEIAMRVRRRVWRHADAAREMSDLARLLGGL